MHRNDQIPSNAEACTPSDSAFFDYVGLYVGTGGTVALKTKPGGSSISFVNLPSGSILPLRVCQVLSTGTTASNIVGFKA